MEQICKDSIRTFCSLTSAGDDIARKYLTNHSSIDAAIDAYFEDKNTKTQNRNLNIPRPSQSAFIIDEGISNSANSHSIQIIDDEPTKVSKSQAFGKGESAFKKFNQQQKGSNSSTLQNNSKSQKSIQEENAEYLASKQSASEIYHQSLKKAYAGKLQERSPMKHHKLTPEKHVKKESVVLHANHPKMLNYDSEVIGDDFDSDGVNTSSSVEATSGVNQIVYEMKDKSKDRTQRPMVEHDDDGDSIESIITKSKFMKNRRFRAKPLNPAVEILLDGENLPLKLRKDYNDYIKAYWNVPKGKFTLRERWPKYLGSIVVDCKLPEKGDYKINVGDPLTFRASDIEFGYKNLNTKVNGGIDQRRARSNEVVCFIKSHLLYTSVFHKNIEVGTIWCKADEIFVFLLSKNYVMLEGTVLSAVKSSLGVKTFRMQLDILLTQRIITNPLKIKSMLDTNTSKKRKQRDLEDPEIEDGFTQEESHILRLTKDALIRLFHLLKLKIKVPTVIKSQFHKEDSFTKLLKEKYHKSSDIFQGPAPVLITKNFPKYYAIDENKLQNEFQKNPGQKKVQVFDLTSDDTDVQEVYENDILRQKMSLQEEKERDYSLLSGINSNYFKLCDPSKSCKTELHPYQKQALTWMMYREDCLTDDQLYQANAERFRKLHDLYEEILLIDNSEIYFNPFDGRLVIDFPRSKLCKGGILADEMGLGKTVVAIALIHSHNPLERKIAMYKRKPLTQETIIGEKVKEKKNDVKAMIQKLKVLDQKSGSDQKNGSMLIEAPEKEKEKSKKSSKNQQQAAKAQSGKPSKEKDLVDEFLATIIPGMKAEENEEASHSKSNMAIEPVISRRHSSDSDEDIDPPESLWSRLKQSKVLADPGIKKTMKQLKKTTATDKAKQEEALKEIIKDSENSSAEEVPSSKPKEKDSKKKGSSEWEPKAKKVKSSKQESTKDQKEDLAKRVEKFEPLEVEEVAYHGGTLIIMPLTVLCQWENELLGHSEENSITVLQYYGSGRKKAKLTEYDVVLTTYGVLEYEYAHETGGLADIEWYRVILDEAHQIKSRTTKTSKAAFALNATYRWCMTGTPLQNKLDDLFSILQFLKVEIWGDYFWWNNYINKYSNAEEAAEIARSVLQPILLRRTKKSTYENGKGILDLPPKDVKTCWVKLTDEERRVYSCFYLRGKERFDEIISLGKLKFEYAHIFELLIRLRQVCDHPSLVFKKDETNDRESLEAAISKFLEKNENKNGAPTEHVAKTLESLRKNRLEPCSICLEQIITPVLTSCGHIFCRECILKSYEVSKKCPYCKSSIENEDFMTVIDEDPEDEIMAELTNVKTSSKLIAVINQIKNVRNRGEKCVVFSQFIKMMNILEQTFKEENIEYRRIDGSTRMQIRARNIDEFKTIESITVVLISLKAGAAGINLVAANNVFLVDPWWNPAIEDQAIERVYRIGQVKKVNVIRFICEKTIEERMFQLNEKKKKMINMTLSYNPEDSKQANYDNIMFVMKDFD